MSTIHSRKVSWWTVGFVSGSLVEEYLCAKRKLADRGCSTGSVQAIKRNYGNSKAKFLVLPVHIYAMKKKHLKRLWSGLSMNRHVYLNRVLINILYIGCFANRTILITAGIHTLVFGSFEFSTAL